MLDMYRMFVRPEGAPGEFGADLMERNGRPMADQAVARLELRPTDSVIEIGFGPGLGLEALARAVPGGSSTADFSVVLKLRNTDALDEFNESVSDPASPQYGQYLTPAEFHARYSPSQATVDAVTSWIRAQGLRVENVSGNRTLIDVSGSGKATARATHGNWYQLLFNGDKKAFESWYFNDSSAAQPSAAEAKSWWKDYKLENKYELLAGGLPGESVACHGDSGGPLLRGSSAATLTTYGVSFAVEGTISSACGLGGGYLVFNRKMLDFVRQSL